MSTRLLTLHWFTREEDAGGTARVGLAIPRAVGSGVVRNRLKRQLRAVWAEGSAAAPQGCDYVLVARPGLAEPATTRGHDWLVEQVREVLGKVKE